VGIGLIVSVVASLANLGVALLLRRAGKQYNSISLTANSNHLMTDVWTSGGVLIGVGAVAATGWQVLDPIIAILVAINIVWTGVHIIRNSVSGLMDSSISKEDLKTLQMILDNQKETEMKFHAIRTRQAGSVKVISMHVLVPGNWTVKRGHKLVTQIEKEIFAALEDSQVFTHLESLTDPNAMDDIPFGNMPDTSKTPENLI
jgi:cation diffusion facilitator family transporter